MHSVRPENCMCDCIFITPPVYVWLYLYYPTGACVTVSLLPHRCMCDCIFITPLVHVWLYLYYPTGACVTVSLLPHRCMCDCIFITPPVHVWLYLCYPTSWAATCHIQKEFRQWCWWLCKQAHCASMLYMYFSSSTVTCSFVVFFFFRCIPELSSDI